jgi:hypothetical protein
MKYKLLGLMIGSALTYQASAVELEDIDLSAIPNTFANGQVADANLVNENFEYLRNNMDILVQLLEQQKTLSTDATRYAGTYSITGFEVQTGVCGDGVKLLEVNHSYITGTMVSDGSTISGTWDNSAQTLSWRTLDHTVPGHTGGTGTVLLKHTFETNTGTQVTADPASGSIDAQGAISGPGAEGQMTADGNSFYLVYRGTAEDTCSIQFNGSITGTRI